MEKKNYKQPKIKIRQFKVRLLDALSQDPNGTPTAKQGFFDDGESTSKGFFEIVQ